MQERPLTGEGAQHRPWRGDAGLLDRMLGGSRLNDDADLVVITLAELEMVAVGVPH